MKALSSIAAHMPLIPRDVRLSSHAAGTRMSQSDKREMAIVVIVRPDPFMTPFAINMIAKKM